MSYSTVPAGIAGGTIRTARMVSVSTAADNTFLEGASSVVPIAGVTDEKGRAHDDAVNAALVGEQVVLQEGAIVRVEAGAAITRGALLESDAQGRAITAVTTATGAGVTKFQPLIALESAGAAGAKIKAMWAKNATAYN